MVFCFSSYDFHVYKRRTKPLESVASMLPCDALERSNNAYIESVVEPCVSQNEKRSRYVGSLGRKS